MHAVQFIKPGGRLGVVAPGELAHAAYAQPLIKYFCDQFRDVSLVTFDRRIFSHLGEDTVLLMCDGRGVVAPNTLHVVRMRSSSPLNASQLAAAWQSSLVKLSCELSGHSLGGGMLKLEPSEAQSLLIPLLKLDDALVESLDAAARKGRWSQVTDAIDAKLALVLGLAPTDIALLKDGVDLLRGRRTRR